MAHALERCSDVSRIREHLLDSELEVVVLVEGFDPMTSQTVQARHSYMFQSGAIVFNQMFAECMQRDEEGRCMVNLEVFSDLVPDTVDAPDHDNHVVDIDMSSGDFSNGSEHGRRSTWAPRNYNHGGGSIARNDSNSSFMGNGGGVGVAVGVGGGGGGGGGGGETFNPMRDGEGSSHRANTGSNRLNEANRQSTLDELHMSDEDELNTSDEGHTKAT